jgi:CzcA family heavy metal efflux pump
MSDKNYRGIAGFAIRNFHFVVVACLFVVILGGLALARLPKDLLPAANMPAVQLLSFYPGMPVEHVEQDLTARFERYTGLAVGITRQESRSLVGVSIVRNFFGSNIDLNTAISQTTALVMSVLRRLPPGTQPPLILPFDPMAAVPLCLVAVSGDHPEKELYDVARYDTGNAIQAVPGAMAPTVMGGAEREAMVMLDPKKLAAYNLSPLRVNQIVSQLNTFIPSGDVKIGGKDFQIVSNGMVDRITEMDEFPLRSENGVSVYVKDVGRAEDAHKIQTNVVRVDGKRQVYVPVYRQPGANSIQVVDEVKEALAELGKRLGPQGYKLTLVADESAFIRKAIESITDEALIGGGLAALLVFLFLGNPKATFGILLSLPLSILTAMLGLAATGQTLNAMTLGGFALSIGVLVDNSIVVIENISRQLDLGHDPKRAAYEGASEVALPVLASTLATMVVFLPVIFLSGISKILFSALAMAVVFAMAGSYLASMAVMPLFAARALRAVSHHELPGLLKLAHHAVVRLTEAYEKALSAALKARGLVLGGALALVAAGAALAPRIGTELFPRADAGHFTLLMRLASGTRVEQTEAFTQEIESKLRKWIPAHDLKMIISNAGVYYGFPAAFTPNAGTQDVFMLVDLAEDRRHSSQYYAKIIRAKLKLEYPGVDSGVQLGGLMSSALNRALPAPIDVQLEGADLPALRKAAEQLAERIKALPGAVDVRVQQRLDAPQIQLEVDRKKAKRVGLTTEEVVKNVVSSVAGSETFNPTIWVDPKSGIDYLLGVRVPEKRVDTLEQLASLPITGTNQDRSLPLSAVAKLSMTQGASEINHVNLRPVVDVYADAQGRDIGGLSKDILAAADGLALPPGASIHVRGEIEEMTSSVRSLGGGFLLAATLVYLILVVQFRSFSLPAVIMATVPLGLVGIAFMLEATGTYFSIQAAIGAIFMIGIAVANGVLLIEFILHKAKESPDIDSAILAGAKARLRPILMTSLSSVLGLVPMAVGLGRGAEANIPLGRAVIGGQLVSVTLTLFVLPVLFSLLRSSGQASEAAEAGGDLALAEKA